tara:strand:- start:988 stop:1302 length:315 start_codon:yes stop_codon:yes gene_type:complete
LNSQIEKIIEDQGWNDESVLSILWAYVEAQGQDDAVLDHFLNAQVQENEPEIGRDSLPCEREWDPDSEDPGWNCNYDHTGCLWNDGNNTCSHSGDNLSPLEDSD